MLEELNAHEDEVDQELLRVLPHVVPEVAEKYDERKLWKEMRSDPGDVIP